MIDLLQNLIDGLGRGSIYALLALGIAVIFGVMHMVNFAHGELITVTAYIAFGVVVTARWGLVGGRAADLFGRGWGRPVAIEFVAFRWVRGASDFTMLLTSFAVHFLVQAIFVMDHGRQRPQLPPSGVGRPDLGGGRPQHPGHRRGGDRHHRGGRWR